MVIKRFFEPLLAQTSYLVGCGRSGQAIVIDPNRDAEPYLATAAAEHLVISHVTETHVHADFLSGSRELARRAGASLLLSGEGGPDWQYGFASEAQVMHAGDRITIGNVAIDVVHTPGHTPEHLTFLITDGAVADAPIAAATGDFIFVGDVGRPDLLERAVHQKGTMEAAAKTLYCSLQRFSAYEDWLQIWPGHGAGSSCGKGISDVPHSTLGYERRFNWAFKAQSEADFIANVLAGQPDPPTYFATMKRLNKEGPPPAPAFVAPHRLDRDELGRLLASGAPIVDTRPAAEYAAGFVPGTLNLPLTGNFVTWAGWLLPYSEDVYLMMGEGSELRLPEVVRALALIGLDRIAGYFSAAALEGRSLAEIPQLQPADVARLHGEGTPAVLIDVRYEGEWRTGHLPGAIHVPLGHLAARLPEIPTGQPVITHCQAGTRSAIASSLLRRAGFRDVRNLVGGYDAWKAAGLPTVS